MNRAILIELAMYTPPLRSYLNQQEKKQVKEEVGLTALVHFQWEKDMIIHRAVDLVEEACKNRNDWDVYHLLNVVGYTNDFFVNLVAEKAAEYNREQLLQFMISCGAPKTIIV